MMVWKEDPWPVVKEVELASEHAWIGGLSGVFMFKRHWNTSQCLEDNIICASFHFWQNEYNSNCHIFANIKQDNTMNAFSKQRSVHINMIR